MTPSGPESPVITVDRTNPLPPPEAPDASFVIGATTAAVSWLAGSDPGPVTSGLRSYVLHVVEEPGGGSEDYAQLEQLQEISVSPGHTYTLTVDVSDNAGNTSVPGPPASLTYLDSVELSTRCGCGAGGGGPAIAGALLLLSLWTAARKRR